MKPKPDDYIKKVISGYDHFDRNINEEYARTIVQADLNMRISNSNDRG